ncbi:hypothetical protein N0V93_008139 [Gnomoniopsis smithogilvyi]|uniref:Uncharacterized protein n=1 Tax=Gnomoniopsis smithogilvyi TaxID=1191159 RepID=A0A9W9CUL1_9PEZI|nr:hypothetical protein N0V93_008139 [Gnomoniopsis smithogilvyi]
MAGDEPQAMAASFGKVSVFAASLIGVLSDALVASRLALWNSRVKLLRSWILVPSGILVILVACFGVDTFFKHFGVSFPASVACMLLLFTGLWVCELIAGSHRTRQIVAAIDVPAGWSLRWISVFFTPTFVVLPLSPSITAGELGRMIAVFVIGFAIMFVFTAYMTRGLQLVTGSHKKAQAARAEELGPPEDEIPVALATPGLHTPLESTDVSARTSTVALQEITPPEQTLEPLHIQPVTDQTSTSPPDDAPSPLPLPHQTAPPPQRARLWAAVLQAHLDTVTYLLLFLFVGLPVYYTITYAMPLQLTFTVLMYFAALSLPLKWKQVLHPVIVSAFLTVLGVWIFGLMHRQSLTHILESYTTGLKYLQIWEHAATTSAATLPGAGDILSTTLDASIVSLALPMFQYRRELVQHFTAIVLPNLVLSIGSLYAYPSICFAIGISATRSLAFASRSLTLALAIPATENLGGDRNTVAAVAIMSGIVGALIGGRVLTWLKIPEDDYVTRGVTLGANSSAVATALLLRSDPRAAALSSLSMSLFGTITVLFTSIPPIANTVRSLVDF